LTRPYQRRDPLALAWRSRERVQERHEYIIDLAGRRTNHWNRQGRAVHKPFTLKEIALRVMEKFGTENGRDKPLDHTSIMHHIWKHRAGRCACELAAPETERSDSG
jgi:hypothetical protein